MTALILALTLLTVAAPYAATMLRRRRRARRDADLAAADQWAAELRQMTRDLAAERRKPSRATTLSGKRRDYDHRRRMQAAGWPGVFPGGPRGRLP